MCVDHNEIALHDSQCDPNKRPIESEPCIVELCNNTTEDSPENEPIENEKIEEEEEEAPLQSENPKDFEKEEKDEDEENFENFSEISNVI